MAETREQKLAREMSHQPSNAVDIITPIGRGLRRWIPDIAALPGDIADAAIYAARRGATGNRNTPSAGLGAASRQWAREKMEKREPRRETELSAIDEYSNPQQSALEEIVAMANPAMWNPRLLAKPEVLSGLAAAFGGTPGALGVVKSKGGNWLTGSVEDALRGLKRPVYGATSELPEDVAARLPRESLNQWIEGPLTKYVKSRMASPDDEVRRLAEQGVLHVSPDMLETAANPRRVTNKFKTLKERPEYHQLGKSRLGKIWEKESDLAINSERIADVPNKEPWMAGKELDYVYSLNGDRYMGFNTPDGQWRTAMRPDLGFPHLIDELSNALNPASGLPRNLQLNPKAVENMSMEKAVRLVSDINAWRAAQKIEANRKLAEQAAIVREYAENNPKGLRWVELKHDPETALPEGWSAHQDPKSGKTFYMDASGRKSSIPPTLEQQLKYEGDTMGHCVGGYCDDVLSGRSRIFSLRDAKGEPHVTIEVSPQPRNIGQQDIPDRYVEEAMNQLHIYNPEDQWGREEEIDKLAGAIWKMDHPDQQRIVQIKGKQNRAPNEEYLPFVQDFVRNSPLGSPWSEVGDLENTGLTYFPKNEPRQAIQHFLPHEGPYYTRAEMDAADAAYKAQLPNYASGGPVRGFADGGWQGSVPSEYDYGIPTVSSPGIPTVSSPGIPTVSSPGNVGTTGGPTTVSGLAPLSALAYQLRAMSALDGGGGLGGSVGSSVGSTAPSGFGLGSIGAAFGTSAFGLSPTAHAIASFAVPAYSVVNALANVATAATAAESIGADDSSPDSATVGVGPGTGEGDGGDGGGDGGDGGDGGGDGGDGGSGGDGGGGDGGGGGGGEADGGWIKKKHKHVKKATGGSVGVEARWPF